VDNRWFQKWQGLAEQALEVGGRGRGRGDGGWLQNWQGPMQHMHRFTTATAVADVPAWWIPMSFAALVLA
jgi:hypothetical protein